MFKMAVLNFIIMSAFSMSAFASKSVCTEYNDIISKQCVSAKKLKGDLSPEMLKGYSIRGCRHDAYKIILESDVFVQASCEPVMSGKLISALK